MSRRLHHDVLRWDGQRGDRIVRIERIGLRPNEWDWDRPANEMPMLCPKPGPRVCAIAPGAAIAAPNSATIRATIRIR